MNINKRKVVDSTFKNYKPFFIKIDTYRDISVQIRPLFANFRPVKFRSRNQTPPNSVRIKPSKAGVPKPGGDGGDIFPNNLTVSPQLFEYGLHLHPPPNNLTLVCI